MAGMLLQGGARALVGSGSAASQPLLTSQPAAATTAQSASQIAFGPSATPAQSNTGLSAWSRSGGHQIVLGGVVGLVGLVLLYRSLPR